MKTLYVKIASIGPDLITVIDKHLQVWGQVTRLEQAGSCMIKPKFREEESMYTTR
jgi:hypothetical protein